MRLARWLTAGLLLPLAVSADAWTFTDPLEVSPKIAERVFHHLESSGRRSIAVAGDAVAITWEDDRDGTPRAYLSIKQAGQDSFQQAQRISGSGEAYEPSIVSISNDRFLLAWEENGQVYARVASARAMGPVIMLSGKAGGQVSLASRGNDIIVAWSERAGQYGQIHLAQLQADDAQQLAVIITCAADDRQAEDEQLYPAVAMLANDIIVAWEDRRPGHTIIMAAQGKPCALSSPVRVSDEIDQRSATYGKGHGVSRVALTPYGKAGLLAVWADKRDFREGYDIYAAHYQTGRGFGGNERVQDDFGGVARQWHPATSGHSDGQLLVVWTDEREGNSDIMLSAYESGEWSEDLPLSNAAGEAEQAHPSIIIDAAGALHLAWVERETRNGPTRLMYLMGYPSKE